jgi:hypothetical protein
MNLPVEWKLEIQPAYEPGVCHNPTEVRSGIPEGGRMGLRAEREKRGNKKRCSKTRE